MNFQKILKQVAIENNTTPEDVYREMQIACLLYTSIIRLLFKVAVANNNTEWLSLFLYTIRAGIGL